MHKIDQIKVEEDFLVEASEIQIEKEALKSQIRKLQCITTSFNKKLAETKCTNDEEKAASEKQPCRFVYTQESTPLAILIYSSYLFCSFHIKPPSSQGEHPLANLGLISF